MLSWVMDRNSWCCIYTIGNRCTLVNWNVWAIQTSHTDQFTTGHSSHWFWTFFQLLHVRNYAVYLFEFKSSVVLFIFNSWVVFTWKLNKIKCRITAARARSNINVVTEEREKEKRMRGKKGKTNRKKEMPGKKGSWKQVVSNEVAEHGNAASQEVFWLKKQEKCNWVQQLKQHKMDPCVIYLVTPSWGSNRKESSSCLLPRLFRATGSNKFLYWENLIFFVLKPDPWSQEMLFLPTQSVWLTDEWCRQLSTVLKWNYENS